MRLELNADGIIRDADTGEHYGHVPQSLRPLYAAAPKLLAALKNLLRESDDDGITRNGVDQAFAAINEAENAADGIHVAALAVHRLSCDACGGLHGYSVARHCPEADRLKALAYGA